MPDIKYPDGDSTRDENEEQADSSRAVLRRRFFAELLVLMTLLPALFVVLDHKPGLMEANVIVDDQFARRRTLTISQDIEIVGIDRESIDTLGSWPWGRRTYGHLLNTLADHGAQCAMLDAFLDLPSNEEDERLLVAAMKRIPTFLPLNFQPSAKEAGPVEPTYTGPSAAIAQAAAGVGHVNTAVDADGLVRGIFRFEENSQGIHPYLGLLMLGSANGERVVPIPDEAGVPGWRRTDRFDVPFSNSTPHYPSTPFISVLRGDRPLDGFQGKCLFVGFMPDSGTNDVANVAGQGKPYALAGVEVHAMAYDALRQGVAVDVLTGWRQVAWIALPIWLALVFFIVRSSKAVAVTVGMVAAVLTIYVIALVFFNISLPAATPVAGVLSAYLIWSWRRLNTLLLFFVERTALLHALASGPFDRGAKPVRPLDFVERYTYALDQAIDRVAQLQSLLSEGLWTLPSPVFICKGSGSIVRSNDAAQDLFSGAVAQPQPTWHHNSQHSGDPLARVNLLHLMRDLVRVEVSDPLHLADQREWNELSRGEYTTPSDRTFRVRAAPLEGREGRRVDHWVVVFVEVTAERRAQREREKWFGFLSHDLRSPQVAIVGLIERHRDDPSGRSVDDLLQDVSDQAWRTMQLAERFMDMVEAESGLYDMQPVLAGALVLDAIDAMFALASTKGITLDPSIRCGEALVLADPILVIRAFNNLLANAIRHSPVGSTIRVCTSVDTAADEIFISFHDEGDGMTDRQVEQLLARADRRKSDGSHGSKGWGIGMGIVHAVLDRHGAELDIISAIDAGSTFVVRFHRLSPSQADRLSLEAPQPVTTRKSAADSSNSQSFEGNESTAPALVSAHSI